MDVGYILGSRFENGEEWWGDDGRNRFDVSRERT